MTTAIQDRTDVSASERRRRPVPIEIADGGPHSSFWLHLAGGWRKARSMDNLWKITDEWWDGRPVIKMYFRVTTEDRSQIIIFQDLLEGTWYREGVGDEGAGEAAESPAAQINQQAVRKTLQMN